MTKFPVQGGCHCGAVRYTLLAPAMSVQHCHCLRCRKLSGGLIVSGAVIARADIRIESTENLTTYRSSPSFARKFCKTCGCPLFEYEDSEPRLMYLLPGTLDGGVHPGHPAGKEAHIYVGSKAEWNQIGDDLPTYDTSCPDDIITELQR
jgi:hypothetical protein